MATNRIRISKQTELSTTPRSIVITNATNEQQYLPPGSNGDVLTVVSGIPTWQAVPVNNLINLVNIMGGVAINETPSIGDTTTFRNGLHLAVVGNDNQVMLGGNMNKTTEINMIPQTGDGVTPIGYMIRFDGSTGAPAGTALPRFVVNLAKKDTSATNSLTLQVTRNSLHVAAARGLVIANQIDGAGLVGANSFVSGSDSNVASIFMGSNYRNFDANVTNVVGHEYQGLIAQGNWQNCVNHVLPDICGMAVRAAGSGSTTSTIPWRTDLYLAGTSGGLTGGVISQSRKLVICSRDTEGLNQANIQISDSGNIPMAFNSRSNTPLTGLWNIYSDVTRESWIRGNIMLGGALAVVPTFQLQLSTDSAAKPTTSLWTIVSDRSTKKNIQKSKIDSLEVFSMLPDLSIFEHNDKVDSTGLAIGYMADELSKIPFATKVIKKATIGNVDSVQAEKFEKQAKEISLQKEKIWDDVSEKFTDEEQQSKAYEDALNKYLSGIVLEEQSTIISNEVDTVNYHELMMLSFDAIKQLTARVKELEAKI